MGHGLLSGGVFRGAAIGGLGDEGLADVELCTNERRDGLCPVRVLDASGWSASHPGSQGLTRTAYGGSWSS